MKDLKLVVYKENHTPRTVSLSTRNLYKMLILSAFLSVLFLISVGVATRYYLLSRNAPQQTFTPNSETDSDTVGPSNSTNEQMKYMKDQVDALRAQLQSKAAAEAAPQKIDTTNPVFALFPPNVVDRTNNQDSVTIKSFQYTPGTEKNPALFTFELHNAHEGQSTEKGYIILLARGRNGLASYPDVFSGKSKYLIEVERGETFQVARFRFVNGQFNLKEEPESIQILLFNRNSELLINTFYEVKGR